MSRGNFVEESIGKVKPWSIMVYLAGGNDASNEARESLLRMKQVGSTDNIHVVAQFDSGSEGTSTKRYYLSPFKNSVGIETLLSQDDAKMPFALESRDSTAGMNYYQQLNKTLSVGQRDNLGKLHTEAMIRRLKYFPDRFKNFALGCILDEDVFPRPSGDLGQTNAGDPKVLVEFIQWAKVRFPAKHHMVILWGHGNGLSVAWDFSPSGARPDALTIQKLKKAFSKERELFQKEEAAFRREERRSARKADYSQKQTVKYRPGVDIVGFNSCSLGTIEVYYQLRKLIDFGIASEGFTPKTSWPYDRILKNLDKAIVRHGDMSPEDFALRIVREYTDYYRIPVMRAEELQKMERKRKRLGATFDKNSGWYTQGSDLNIGEDKPSPDLNIGMDKPSPDLNIGMDKPSPDLGLQGVEAGGGIDLSVCDLKRSDRVTQKMRTLVHFLSNKLSPKFDAPTLAAILSAHAISQSYFNKDYTDLYDFCRALQSFSSNQSIKTRCQAVMDAISDPKRQGSARAMCIEGGHVGSDVRNSFGVSIFFPWGEQSAWGAPEVIARYNQLDFSKKTGWATFLRRYRGLGHQFQARTGAFKTP
jgi:hypothetical protein